MNHNSIYELDPPPRRSWPALKQSLLLLLLLLQRLFRNDMFLSFHHLHHELCARPNAPSSFAAIIDRSIRIDGPESCSFDKGALCSHCHRVEIGQRIRSVCCTQLNSHGRMILKESPKRNEIAYECIRLMESFLSLDRAFHID